MATAIGSILRASTRKEGEPLNILTYAVHERYQTGLAKTGHNFWLFDFPGAKKWNPVYAPLPSNHVVLNAERGMNQFPREIEFDLVLSQNKFAHYELSASIAKQLHLPLICLEHCTVHPSWTNAHIKQFKNARGDINVFISEFNRRSWGWGDNEAIVVHHGVDTNTFSPNDKLVSKKNHILSVVNEFDSPERFYCCGYPFWKDATDGLPTIHVGTSKTGWSSPAKSIAELVLRYRECAVFVDTASASPIPSVLLEAMACGCVCVSRGNMMVKEVIQDGYNGFIREDSNSMRALLKDILSNPQDYEHVRAKARETIVEKFSMDKFVKNWNNVFQLTANVAYRG